MLTWLRALVMISFRIIARNSTARQ